MEMNQIGPSLRWMLLEASVAGLRLVDGTPEQWEGAPKIHNSMSLVWRAFEIFPFVRLTYRDADGLTWWCVLCTFLNFL